MVKAQHIFTGGEGEQKSSYDGGLIAIKTNALLFISADKVKLHFVAPAVCGGSLGELVKVWRSDEC